MGEDNLRADKPDPELPWELAGAGGSQGIPPDAQRLGLDRNTEEGALIAFSGALDRSKPSHRIVAWLLLLSFGLPVAVTGAVFAERLLKWLYSG